MFCLFLCRRAVNRITPLIARNIRPQQSTIVSRGRKSWTRGYLKSLYKRRLDQGPEPERPRSVWINWNYEAELYSFGKRLGEEISNETLRKAFTTSSYVAKEQARRSRLEMDETLEMEDNEELVLAGERIAKSYVRAYIQHCWPLLPEQGLQSVLEYLMDDDKLCHVASNLGIKDLVLTQEFPPSVETMSSAFKAVIGAIEVDEGREKAELFVQDFVITQLVGRSVEDMWDIVNPMGLLVDELAKRGRGPPEPRLLFSSGSSTILAVYMVGLYSDRQLVGRGAGETTPIAEEMAARNSLLSLYQLTDSRPPLPLGTAGRSLTPTPTGRSDHSSQSVPAHETHSQQISSAQPSAQPDTTLKHTTGQEDVDLTLSDVQHLEELMRNQ